MSKSFYKKNNLEKASKLLQLLGNQARLMIVCMLSEEAHSVSEIAEKLKLSQSAVSQHLAKLRKEKIVSTSKDAQKVNYSLVKGPALEIIGALHKVYC